jgi:hypothetical protein
MSNVVPTPRDIQPRLAGPHARSISRPRQKRPLTAADVTGTPVVVGNHVWVFVGDLGHEGVVERVERDRVVVQRRDGRKAAFRSKLVVVMEPIPQHVIEGSR